MIRVLLHTLLVVGLTVLTQLGGVAWLIALLFRRRVFAFLLAYGILAVAAVWFAPVFGREPVGCTRSGPLRVKTWAFCALNRSYVQPELAEVLNAAATALDRDYPGTVTRLLDANFPFADGFPLLPHLSHDDGGKADIALFYRDDAGYLPGKTRSPIGYLAFEPGPTACPRAWPTLRWDLDRIQPLWPEYDLEPDRTRAFVALLAADPRVGRIFLEPHLAARLGLDEPKLGFQGCRAARHDDHIHVQLR